MTLVSQIINDAYRQSNLLAIGVSPTTLQQEEALRYLNRIVKSVFGNEIGGQLEAFSVGSNDISRPSGFPWYGQDPGGNWFIPKNKRLMLNLNAAQDIFLHPIPDDGGRFAIADPSENLATYNVTVYGNGNLIEGQESIVLDTDGLDREWFFRQDQANWVRSSPLTSSDDLPFPEEFDDFFITMLAVRLNPSYGTQLDPQSNMALSRARTQMRARYQVHVQMNSEIALLRMAYTATDRDYFGYGKGYWEDPTSTFDRGFPW